VLCIEDDVMELLVGLKAEYPSCRMPTRGTGWDAAASPSIPLSWAMEAVADS
jgi:hypothetical protein